MESRMSRRQLQQYSLADSFVKRKAKGSRWLEDIDKVIDWAPVVAVLSTVHSSSVGAPAFPPLPMFKILLLQQWYCLSDEGIEAAVDDRLSFRRFCGFPLDQVVPDHATIWRFRESLGKLGLAEAAFDALNAQLEHRGLIVKRGTLVDATIIAAAAAPPNPKTGVVSEIDPDASWTTKNGTSTFGYKAHIAVDEGSNLIRQIEGTSADVHDSQAAAALVQGDEQAFYADKGYDSDDLRRSLKDRGIEPCVMYKAHRNTPLTTAQALLNSLFSGPRSAVERSFATMKRHYRLARVRYFGLRRNHAHFQLVAFAINLKRVLVLETAAAAATIARSSGCRRVKCA